MGGLEASDLLLSMGLPFLSLVSNMEQKPRPEWSE
jgi:hypothetical protein